MIVVGEKGNEDTRMQEWGEGRSKSKGEEREESMEGKRRGIRGHSHTQHLSIYAHAHTHYY